MYLKKKELLEQLRGKVKSFKQEMDSAFGVDEYRFAKGKWFVASDLEHKIQSGAFDAQVFSTTNLYICPKCEVISDQNSWNMATRKIFGDDIGEIQTDEGDIFICPSCKGKSDRTEINPIQSNNAGMEKGAEG